MRNESGNELVSDTGCCGDAPQGSTVQLEPQLVSDLCTRLLSRSARQAALYTRSSRMCSRPEVIRRLVALSFEFRSADPARSLWSAKLAFRLARRACRGHAEPGQLDALAETAANLGNLYRLREQFDRAEHLIAAAENRLTRGTGSPQVRGWVLLCAAPLHLDRGRLHEAHEASLHALRLFTALEEPESATRAAILRWAALFYSGRLAESLDQAQEVMKLSQKARAQDLGLLALHNLLLTLEALRYSSLALDELARAETFYQRHGTPSLLLRASWLKGRLCCSLNQLPEAAQHLEHVRGEFLTRNLLYDAALAGIDLALVYAKQKKLHLVYKLASEMLPVFAAQQVPREASAVLLLFAKTAELWRADALAVESFLATLAPIRRSSGR